MTTNPQIKIQYTGVYQLSKGIVLTDPLVTAMSATDDFVSSVSVACNFSSETYAYGTDIGSFSYNTTWTNADIELFINEYMNARKI